MYVLACSFIIQNEIIILCVLSFCSLTIENATSVYAGQYRCAASNYAGKVMSQNMTLYVGGTVFGVTYQ